MFEFTLLYWALQRVDAGLCPKGRFGKSLRLFSLIRFFKYISKRRETADRELAT
jgi:hypothetical protein